VPRQIIPIVRRPKTLRRPESVPAALARASREERGRIAVKRQRRGVAHIAQVEADISQLAPIHI
jgi:hypothetical protein